MRRTEAQMTKRLESNNCYGVREIPRGIEDDVNHPLAEHGIGTYCAMLLWKYARRK
jgi:hypothetical protein